MNHLNVVLRREIKNTMHEDGKFKQTKSCKDDKITKTNEMRLKIYGNHLFK